MSTRMLATLFCSAALVGACKQSDSSRLTDTTLGGDVDPDSAIEGVVFHGVKQPLTSENFNRFTVAQRALDSVSLPANLPRVNLRNPTDEEIEATVKALEENDDARRAIESSGMSVKDFVLTSLALGQALNFPTRARALIPQENVAFIEHNRAEIQRVRNPRVVRVFIDDDDDRLRRDEHDEDEHDVRHGRRHDDDKHDRGRHRGHGHDRDKHGGHHDHGDHGER